MKFALISYADHIDRGVEILFSLQRQTIQLTFDNIKKLRISRYQALNRTRISLQEATQDFSDQVLTNQMAVRKTMNGAFQLKLPNNTKKWDTLQKYRENAFQQIDNSVIAMTKAAKQSQKAESKAQLWTQYFLNNQLDIIQKNISKAHARPVVMISAQEHRTEEALTEGTTESEIKVVANHTGTATQKFVDSLHSGTSVLGKEKFKLMDGQPTKLANNVVLGQAAKEEESPAIKAAKKQKSSQKTGSNRSSRLSK
jgi:hypothetical protein